MRNWLGCSITTRSGSDFAVSRCGFIVLFDSLTQGHKISNMHACSVYCVDLEHIDLCLFMHIGRWIVVGLLDGCVDGWVWLGDSVTAIK